MNTKTFIVLVAIIALASAGTLSSSKKAHAKKELNSEAHYQALKETAFGKNLFNMMSLKFKTSGQLDTILELLDELATNINQQQADDDSNFEAASAKFTETIDNQNAIIVESSATIEESNRQIEADTNEKNQATSQRDTYLTQIDGIVQFLEVFKETRERENADYLQRTADQEAILAGLDEVITLFSAELENDPNLDHDAAEAVLDLLNEIRASVQASLADDTQAENTAQLAYNNYVDEQTALLADLRSRVDDLNTQIDNLTASIENLTETVAEETVKRDNATELRNTTQEALDTATATHSANTQTRSGQITLIGQVKARLRNNSDDVQSFLNNA